jgi:methylmalonyl-CoA/ethylmalonyl-CoA epimerase
MFHEVDHIAIVVKDTGEALRFYRDTLRLPFLFSEVLAEQNVRLTHLDLGKLHLQLVEPLTADHPLSQHLRERGEGLHHLCFRVASIPEAMAALPGYGLVSRDKAPRRGPRGRQAAFIDPAGTRGVLLELTAEGPQAGGARP